MISAASRHNLPFLDTHVHLMDKKLGPYHWAEQMPALAGQSFHLDRYNDAALRNSDAEFKGAIHVEAALDKRNTVDEIKMVAGVIEHPDSLIVGQIAGCAPEWSDCRIDLAEECHILGFRRVLFDLPHDTILSTPFLKTVRQIGASDLVFELCGDAEQLPAFGELASVCPETLFVLDHAGLPDLNFDTFEGWRRDLSKIGRLPNVTCKMSGMLPERLGPPATIEDLEHYFDVMVEVFGPSRIMWGSDWPVVIAGGGFESWMAASFSYLSRLSPSEAHQITEQTARLVYGI